MNFSRIDGMALCGYEYAGGAKQMPELRDQLDIDSFNAGIANFNARNGTCVPPLHVVVRSISDGTNTGQSPDKSLAIVGA